MEVLVCLVDFRCELVDAATEVPEGVFHCPFGLVRLTQVRPQGAGLSGFSFETFGGQSVSEVVRCSEQDVAQLDACCAAGLDCRVSDQVKIADSFHRSGGVRLTN